MKVAQLCIDVDKKKYVKEALNYLTRTEVQANKTHHQPCVCVVCDSFIIGTEKTCYLSKDELLNKKSYLDLSYLEDIIGKRIPSTL